MAQRSLAAFEGVSVEDLVAEFLSRIRGPNVSSGQSVGSATASGGKKAEVPKLVYSPGSHGSFEQVDEDTEGYCYLKLFGRAEHEDAAELGAYPTTAEIRRFSNGRADPFGMKKVVIGIVCHNDKRVAHVEYNESVAGVEPVAALAALAKGVRVGGLPDGVSEFFPPEWIPADFACVVAWSYILPGTDSRPLDVLTWIGDNPHFLRSGFETISATTTKVRWTLRADPLGPETATVDIIDNKGKVVTARNWTSYVAHTGYHQAWKVRGNKVFAQVEVWRAAKILSDPRSPAPAPTPRRPHEELLTPQKQSEAVLAPHYVPADALREEEGLCYAVAFKNRPYAVAALGRNPTVGEVLEHGRLVGEGGLSHNATLQRGDGGLHHATLREDGQADFWQELKLLDFQDRVGATQGQAVKQDEMENVNFAPVLTLRPRAQGMLINVPFVCIMEASRSRLKWDLTTGQKLSGLMSYFESVEMVSLHIKVTVHKGDNDTLVSVVADTMESLLVDDEDWVGAAHTLHVSGNSNGATSGEFKLDGNHSFGTQLKGVAVGNPPPIIQAKLETTVSATAYLKAVITLKVTGSGVPKAMVLVARNTSGTNGSAG